MTLPRMEGEYFVVTGISVHQESSRTLTIYAPGARKLHIIGSKKKSYNNERKKKRLIYKCIGGFNIPLLAVDRTNRQKAVRTKD